MLSHYFRVALRTLARQKVLTAINITGLSLGLACFCLILLFAVNEYSYDNWHVNAGRIYQVDERWISKDGRQGGTDGLSEAIGPALSRDFPEVETFVRLSSADEKLMRGNGETMRNAMSFADKGFFSIFSFPLLSGSAAEALKDPHSVVITKTKAIQLFGTADAVGKTLQVKFDTTYRPFTVSAVAADLPNNSSIYFDVLGSMDYLFQTDSFRRQAMTSWRFVFGDQTWVMLKPGSRLAEQPDRLLQFRWRYNPDEAEAFRKEKQVRARLSLQPLLEVHTDPSISSSGVDATDPKNIRILLAIAAGILLIASINFTTLAIARSAGRAVEVGVRKVVGGRRGQLIRQFLMESVILSVISALLGYLLVVLLLPWFNELAETHLVFSFSQFPQLIWMLAGLTLLVGLLAGCYPALVLSGFRPVEVLKSKIKLGGSNYFTRGLVTLQFVLSIGLITCTVIILRQVSYLRSKDLGLIKENTVAVYTRDVDAARGYALLKHALAQDKAVLGVTATQFGFGAEQGMMNDLYKIHGIVSPAIVYPVELNFIPVMGMRLVAGRNFDPGLTSDTVNSVIVNETLVHDYLGCSTAEAIGQRFESKFTNGPGRFKTVIGVVRDFNFDRLNRKVRPQLFLVPADLAPRCYYVHLRGGDPTPTLAAIGAFWKSFAPDVPLRYGFLDDALGRFYKSEMRWGDIIACAGGIAIFLACMGLFGLAALAAANRLREIGIRRVLGASGLQIVSLLTGNFMGLVMVAALISSPLAWYFMSKWLQQFAYRIDISGWIFAVTALAALAIAWLTIGTQAWRAAQANPAENLRTE
jgi:putative ABC transport system permease protein